MESNIEISSVYAKQAFDEGVRKGYTKYTTQQAIYILMN